MLFEITLLQSCEHKATSELNNENFPLGHPGKQSHRSTCLTCPVQTLTKRGYTRAKLLHRSRTRGRCTRQETLSAALPHSHYCISSDSIPVTRENEKKPRGDRLGDDTVVMPPPRPPIEKGDGDNPGT